MKEAPLDEVSGKRLMEVTAGIARWVRLSGSEDEMRAVRYVEGLLGEAGLRTRVLMHDAYVSWPGRASLVVLAGSAGGEGGEGTEESLPVITHAMAEPTPPGGLEGEVVYVGAGGPADYADGRARGRVALADGLATPARALAAREGGALALVNVNGRHTHEMIVSPVWGSPAPEDLARMPGIPVFSVDAGTGVRLRSLLPGGHAGGGRGEGSAAPLRVRLHAEVDTRWRQTPILVADLPGESEDFVLFSGHIDSWHLGAMDNGAANATMVEVARVLAGHGPFRRGLRLCFWSGHSHGRYSGSAWYVDHHWEELFDRCVAHVNVDSVGGRGATVLTEAMAMPELRHVGAEAVRRVAGQEFVGKRVGRSGDQSFTGVGIPSLFMECSEQPPSDDPLVRNFAALIGGSPRSGGLGWWWHTTEDTLDKIDEEFLARDCRVYLHAIHRLLAMPALALDYGAAAAEVRADAERLRSLAGDAFDLGEVLRRATELEAEGRRAYEAALRLNAAAERGGVTPVGQLQAFNDAVKAIGRALIPAWFTAAGPFGHDPALPVPPLPLIADAARLHGVAADSDLARALRVKLDRGRNAVAFALRQATAAARRAVAEAERVGGAHCRP